VTIADRTNRSRGGYAPRWKRLETRLILSASHRPMIRNALLTIGTVLLCVSAPAPFAAARSFKGKPAKRAACPLKARHHGHRILRKPCTHERHTPGDANHSSSSTQERVPPRPAGTQPTVAGGAAQSQTPEQVNPGSTPPVGSLADASPTTTSAAPLEPAPPFRFFASTSFWNVPVPTDAAIDPSSSAVISTFASRVAAEEQSDQGPWINTTAYSVPVYTVPSSQPNVTVHLTGTSEPALSTAWKAVPLPPTATPASGADGLLVVWQPSTDRLWEFWRLVHKPEGWSASWGSAMEHASSSQGVYGTGAWPDAEPWWGASASSLSLVGGLISLEDLKLGQINHALEMAIPDVRSNVYASPAQRSDGKTADTLSLPEGAHLRLNPNLDLATLHLPHLTLMLAEAAQRYGIFITDSSATTVFYAQDPTNTEANPYTGTAGYFEGQQPNKLLASFPWNQLELLKMELRSK
jgi:hypothetical protein